PTVIGTVRSVYLAANPEAHRKFLECVPESDRPEDAEQQLSTVNPVAVIVVGGAAGAVLTAGLAVSFWADEKIEQGLRRLKVPFPRSEEHTSELQSRFDLVCRLLLAKKKQ